MISNEDVFEKQLLSEGWLNYSQYANLDKIKLNLQSLKYFINEEKTLEKYCTEKYFKHVLSKKDLSKSKNAKTLCRTGIPCKYIREFLLKLYNLDCNEEAFKNKHSIIFRERDPKQLGDFVPYFTEHDSLTESLPVDFLNTEGIQALKEILWLLNSTVPLIEYSPMIIKITSLFLIFCNKIETYYIMNSLLEINYNMEQTFKIRWHFRFTFVDNMKIISSIKEAIREISGKSGKETFDHFDKINFPSEKLYEDMVFGFFLNYLNFEGITRLLAFYMMEGVKSLYRLCYAIIKTHKTLILNLKSPDDVIKTIRAKTKEITDITKLFNIAYSFKLTRYNNKYEFQKMTNNNGMLHKNSFHLPSFNKKSNILKEGDISELWSKLPVNLKIKDANLIYYTGEDGYSLSTIYSLTDKYVFESDVMFLIETLDDEVFGGIMSRMFKLTNGKYDRPLQSFCVSVRPYVKIYEQNKSCDDIIYCDSQCFMFGGGPKGPAIRVEKDLNSGYTYSENGFDAPCLVKNKDGEFRIKNLEIFILN